MRSFFVNVPHKPVTIRIVSITTNRMPTISDSKKPLLSGSNFASCKHWWKKNETEEKKKKKSCWITFT